MDEDLQVPYHQQDTPYYCGAACAQMVLDSMGEGVLGQDDLYNDNNTHSTAESGWATAPDGLQWTLNNRQSGKYFCLDALSSEDSISRMIVWTIRNYGVAPVALVFGWDHWIVVRGYSASAAPKSSVDTSYSISSFDVNNPAPPTPSPAPPPPHVDPDACGTGGTRGVADEHISYSMWRSTYMTGVPSGHWGGRFVAVCDPDPPPTWGPRPVRKDARRRTDLLRVDEAMDAVAPALAEQGLLERERWRLAFERPLARAQLVERLDQPGRYYYIAATEGAEGTLGLVALDARGGTYLQSAVVDAQRPLLPPFIEAAPLLDRLRDEPLTLPGLEGRRMIEPGLVAVYPHLVWRPCRESLSPFYPFRMIIWGPHRVYVRIADGAAFTSLTTDIRGY